LKDHEAKFPESFRQEFERMVSISRRLRREREASFYGDEETGSPPHRLYTQDDTRQALQKAGLVFERCRGLM
jgi:HEPN domain-containing protein